jgi:hypothetical protein
MRLIREPEKVDFYMIDKSWTNEEREEFSKFIKLRKEKLKKSQQRKEALKSQKGKQPVKQSPQVTIANR